MAESDSIHYPIIVGGGDVPPASPAKKKRAKELIIAIKAASNLEKSLWRKLDRLSERYQASAMDQYGEFEESEPSMLYYDFIINENTRKVLRSVDKLVNEIFSFNNSEEP